MPGGANDNWGRLCCRRLWIVVIGIAQQLIREFQPSIDTSAFVVLVLVLGQHVPGYETRIPLALRMIFPPSSGHRVFLGRGSLGESARQT